MWRNSTSMFVKTLLLTVDLFLQRKTRNNWCVPIKQLSIAAIENAVIAKIRFEFFDVAAINEPVSDVTPGPWDNNKYIHLKIYSKMNDFIENHSCNEFERYDLSIC